MLPSPNRKKLSTFAVLAGLALAAPALAGPPLLCHPFDIGGARSLPWANGPAWLGALSDYPQSRLITDTEALLAPGTPVIVRMETLRRAAIYASRDAQTAADLLKRLTGRALYAKDEAARALAYLDSGYLVEAITEICESTGLREFRDQTALLRTLVGGLDGYDLASKALLLRPGQPAMEFAAALIAAGRHPDVYRAHAQKARAGASADTLLARNIDKVR
jgi:hypothetical protein